MDRLERITYFENALNELIAAERELAAAIERYDEATELDPKQGLACALERWTAVNVLDEAWKRLSAAQPAARELEEYYSGGQWLADFESDERGELPANLPRGVLSEDGAYNALDENRQLLMRMRELADEILRD